jgi:competence protein ComEA
MTPLPGGRVIPSLFPRRGGMPLAPATARPAPMAPPSGLRTVASPPLPAPARTIRAVDLNSASLEQLQTLPGITAAYAKRIVAGRPYRVFVDVVTRAGIPQAVVDHISPPATIRATGSDVP